MAKISIIIPVYNIENYIAQCLESVISQSFQELEIIVVDDGSTDKSKAICKEYAELDSRIILIHKENGGLVSARKAGLKRATGEYIVYVDGDDWLELDAIEQEYELLKKSNAQIAFFAHYENLENVEKKVEHGISSGYFDKERMQQVLYPHMIADSQFINGKIYPSIWDMIVLKSLLEKVQYNVDEDISMGEDAACVYPCLLLADSVVIDSRAFYHYRQTSNSMIKQRPDAQVEQRKLRKLYFSVDEQLKKLSYIYDIRQQWTAYVLSLMLPRADHVYNGIEELDYLFPYRQVRRGMKIALYGAGTYGQRLNSFIKETSICEIAGWFDQNYAEYQQMGFDVKSPQEILKYDFDYVVVANISAKSRAQITNFLQEKGIKSIAVIDEDYLFSEEVLQGFGLVEKG